MIGAVLLGLTVIIHAVAMDLLYKGYLHYKSFIRRLNKHSWKVLILIIVVLGIFGANIVQIWLWAFVYYALETDVLKNFEMALYFSTVTFTTVGYGDIVLNEKWRLLSSFESANGMIILGWSTAFIFEIMSKLYRDPGNGQERI